MLGLVSLTWFVGGEPSIDAVAYLAGIPSVNCCFDNHFVMVAVLLPTAVGSVHFSVFNCLFIYFLLCS